MGDAGLDRHSQRMGAIALPLWPQYTGKGIQVGVEDFAGNFNQSLFLPDSLGGAFPEDKDPKVIFYG